MSSISKRHRLAALSVAALALIGTAAPTTSASAANGVVEPTDARLTPNPLESSDPGTSFTCQTTGPEITCLGDLRYTWASEPGPEDWCAQPLWSIDGSFERRQTRSYAFDSATGQYLEYFRLNHLDIADSLAAAPDADPATGVQTRLHMLWASDFVVPGDLDSRVTRKQGIDTWFKTPHGGIFTLDVGQKSTFLGEDFNLRGRWRVALGDPPAEFGKVCNALGLTADLRFGGPPQAVVRSDPSRAR